MMVRGLLQTRKGRKLLILTSARDLLRFKATVGQVPCCARDAESQAKSLEETRC
jgi:hypothetical protein